MLWPTIFSCLMAHALAQNDKTTTGTGAQTASPVVSLFLPMGSQDSLQASVISAVKNQTTYALTCANNGTRTSACPYNPAITVTEGESTIIWTNTFSGTDTMITASPVTVQCELVGAHIDETPIHGATSAVCTANFAIPGLGMAGRTSTLASTEINYVPVTITAGAEKLAAASTLTAEPTTTSSRAGAFAAVTPMASIGLGGVLGVAMLGVL